jgi:hypothetical protein
MTIDHFGIFRELAMCYCNVSLDHYSFETQALEESEPQYHIAAQNLPHQHMLVVYFQNFNGVVRRNDHRQRSTVTPTGESAKKTSHTAALAVVSRSVNSLLC